MFSTSHTVLVLPVLTVLSPTLYLFRELPYTWGSDKQAEGYRQGRQGWDNGSSYQLDDCIERKAFHEPDREPEPV